MKRWWLVRIGILSVTLSVTAVAQKEDPLVHRGEQPVKAPARENRRWPLSLLKLSNQQPPAPTPLSLRGGAVPTGLGGFYDYQSNGGSPGYLVIRDGEWDKVYMTFMNSLEGGNDELMTASRRVGYAYSSNGGGSWTSNRAIAETRLGYPSLTVTSGGLPMIATHGNFGAGEQTVVFTTPSATEVSNFFPVMELPVPAASGKESGVIWPQITLADYGKRAVIVGSYNYDSRAKEPVAPLQVLSLDINSGEIPARWSVLTDSLSSLTSGGRTVLARSAGGKLGVAWYRFPKDSNDTEDGIYFAESSDGGVSWGSATAVLAGERMLEDFNINGDLDTLIAGANLDLAYLGEEPQIVMTGNMNYLLQFGNILHWSPSKNLRMITISHQEPGLGAYGIPIELRQSNMGSLAYPTISIGNDGRHIVVAFSAVSQTLNEAGDAYTSVSSRSDHLYYRIWGVGSPDGGATWGRPFIIQDFAGNGADSASIEYPIANEVGRVRNGSFELPLTFMARRYPGMYNGIQEDEIAGPITESLQYFQRFTVTPEMFTNVSATRTAPPVVAEKFSVRMLPNVTSGATEMVASLPSSGRVDIRIFTLLGEEVYATTRSSLSGIESIPLDLRDLSPGTYRCAIYQNGYMNSTQVVVAR